MIATFVLKILLCLCFNWDYLFNAEVYKPKAESTYDENIVVKIISQDTPTILSVSFTVNNADTVGLEYLNDFKVSTVFWVDLIRKNFKNVKSLIYFYFYFIFNALAKTNHAKWPDYRVCFYHGDIDG